MTSVGGGVNDVIWQHPAASQYWMVCHVQISCPGVDFRSLSPPAFLLIDRLKARISELFYSENGHGPGL